jgi:galactokinase
VSDFATIFGRAPEFTAIAPGRVNLIGEHTDYNGGYVLPLALPLLTRVELAVRDDRLVRAATTTLPNGGTPSTYEVGREQRSGKWVDYLQGVTQALASEGCAVPGFDALVSSHVPVGSGLSSSAALEVAMLRALRMATACAIDDMAVARLAHKGETEFVGSPVGVMDPLACSLGQPSHALFIQTATLETLRIPMPASVEVAVIDTGISHRNVDGGYGQRRRECEQAATALGVPTLSALSVRDLPRVAQLAPPLDRRARHVITENARVLQAVGALTADQPAAMGALIRAAHQSLSADFEVSLPAIDRLVAIADQEPLVFGARLTGGGFGGAVLLLCRTDSALSAARHVVKRAADSDGLHPRVLLPTDRYEI